MKKTKLFTPLSYFFASVCIFLLFSCSKNDTDSVQEVSQSESVPYQVITKNRTFNLEYLPDEGLFVPSEERDLFENFANSNNFESFMFASSPYTQYMFEDEMSFHRYYRSFDDIGSRNWILFNSIEELVKINTIENEEFIEAELIKLKEELSIGVSVDKLKQLLDTREVASFAKDGNASLRTPVCVLFEHANEGGASLCVECEAVLETFGEFDCYTRALLADLSAEPKSTGGNWNDQASSSCSQIVEGADHMGVRFYRDVNFANRERSCYRSTAFLSPSLPTSCGNLSDIRWCHPPFGKKLDDMVSGVTLKAIWQGCEENWEFF